MAIKSSPTIGGPFVKVLVCTPSAVTQYGRQASPPNEDICAVWVGGAGNLNIVDQDGNTSLILAVPAGTFLPISPFQILAASTTATSILLMYW
jgi:hypothetical protein